MTTEPRVIDLLTTSSTELLVQLRWYPFRRLRLRMRVANSGADVLAQVKRSPPDAVVLESQLPDADAFDLCRSIKKEMGFSDLPVLIVVEKSIAGDAFKAISSSGCDEVISTPMSRGQLYKLLATYLNLPDRKHPRVIVHSPLTARDESKEMAGELIDLTIGGARLKLDNEVKQDQQLRLRIASVMGEPMEVHGKVVWQKQKASWFELAIQFQDLPAQTLKRLEMLITWQIEQKEDGLLVTLHGGLMDRPDLSSLVRQLKGRVVFDLSSLTTINSAAVNTWVNFLRTIPEDVEYRFAHCSVAFIIQAGYIPDVLGRGQIISCFAPFYCPECDYGEEHEVELASLSPRLEPQPTKGSCPTCSAALIFDDIPERYFSFLRPGP